MPFLLCHVMMIGKNHKTLHEIIDLKKNIYHRFFHITSHDYHMDVLFYVNLAYTVLHMLKIQSHLHM